MRYVLAFLVVLTAQPVLAQNLFPKARVELDSHKNGVGLRPPTYPGACAAVGRQKEGDLCVNTSLDLLSLYDGSTFNPVGVQVKKITLGTATTAGGLAAWTPGVRILVNKFVLDITTDASTTPTIDCGIATNATTSSDNLIDGADAGTAAAIFDSNDGTDNGTNGVGKTQAVSSTQAITCSSAGGTAVTAMVGAVYIHYTVP